jgi:hypothetical protein
MGTGVSRPRAFVIKYMPDLRQREPRNVGVVVTDDSVVLSRFIGEDDAGGLQRLTSLPAFIKGKQTYRSWWRHWQSVVEQGPAQDLAERLVPAIGSNYLCELAMVELAGEPRPLGDFLGDAWEALISWEPRRPPETDDFAEITDRLLEPYRRDRRYTVWANRSMTVTQQDSEGTFEMPLHFHYSIRNGRWTHVRRLTLIGEDNSSWDRVHATAHQFSALADSRDQDHRSANRLAFVNLRDASRGTELQMRELERLEVQVVPVNDEPEAARRVTEIIGVTGKP